MEELLELFKVLERLCMEKCPEITSVLRYIDAIELYGTRFGQLGHQPRIDWASSWWTKSAGSELIISNLGLLLGRK